jgi:ABC transporter DrrB family efflux protein
MSQLAYALADGAVVAKRNLIKITRMPELLVWTLMSPVMFVLLFGYVFGSQVEIPGMDYREFLMAGIFVQTVAFGSTWTGAGMAEDMTKGIIDRFRSLPMSRSAVLMGRTFSDSVFYNSTSIIVMAITGLIVGWRIHTSFLEALGGFALLLLFAFAISWMMAYAGLKVKSVEAVNNASFMFIFPLTFVSNVFVRGDLLPGPLKSFANWNPVSSVAQAAREAFGNTGNGQLPVPDVWSLENPILYSIIWVAIILAIFIPLSTREYNKAATR